jgi:hypothetical protein
MQSVWFEALALFVGINTLFFAALSVLQMLPPVRRTLHRFSPRQGESSRASSGDAGPTA